MQHQLCVGAMCSVVQCELRGGCKVGKGGAVQSVVRSLGAMCSVVECDVWGSVKGRGGVCSVSCVKFGGNVQCDAV